MRSVFVQRASGRIAFTAMMVCASFAPLVAATAAGDQQKVLVLYSVRRDTQLASTGDRNLPVFLEQGLKTKPDLYTEYLDGARFPDEEYKAAFYHYLTLK